MEPPKPNEYKPRVPKTKPAIQIFEFITRTDNQKIDGHDRYTVRKQAMKNNTNRRIKGAKYPSSDREDVESEKQLTGPPVIQQALQSKRFRLLPRGLQDLEDKPKSKPSLARSSVSKSSDLMMQTFELSPVDFPDEMFTLDPTLHFPMRHEWTDPYPEFEGGAVFDSQIASHDISSSDMDTLDDLLHSFSALQYQTTSQDFIPPSLDPLSSIPENIPYRARLLIQHDFTESSRARSLMMSVRKSWFALSLTDAALLNVVLSHYSRTYCLLTGQRDSLESMSFTAASIKIINERMNWPDQRTSDGTIAAVAGMVLIEIKEGNEIAAKAHLSGLQRMISLRGGLLKAKFPASLQRMIAWAELNASSVFSTIPSILPYTSPALDVPFYIGTARPSDRMSLSSPSPNFIISWEPIDTDIEQVFTDLRYISSILESDNPKDIEQIDNIWYSDKTYLIQRSLVYLYQHPQLGHSRLDTLSCLAASIYVDSCLRDQRFSAGAIGILVSKLKPESESFLLSYDHEPFEHGEETERSLLWVCAFGAIAAHGRLERGWFVERFARVCERLNVTEWEQAKGILRGKLWNERWENPKGALWREAVERKAHLIPGSFIEEI